MQYSSMNGNDYDGGECLRTKLQKVREKNTSLVSQNHKLMSELENMGYELQQERSKVAYFIFFRTHNLLVIFYSSCLELNHTIACFHFIYPNVGILFKCYGNFKQVKILHLDLAKEKESVHEYEDRIISLEREISSQHQALRWVKK